LRLRITGGYLPFTSTFPPPSASGAMLVPTRVNDYEETTTRLGGRRADIRGFSRLKNGQRMYEAELNVGNWEKGEVQLYMRVEGNDAAMIELAKQIFKSVKLPLPSPERSTPQ